ncbi:hypothetical protein [Oleidesulfovibrio sp.]|uniref:hypothetical protein n=1 Tax=Oleidesulfovibrio sp. TaxID=2909707 RepID=UPI003A8532D9
MNTTLPSKLSATAKKWVKLIHVTAAALWGGGSTSVAVVVCFFHPRTAAELYAFFMCLYYIDMIVIGIGAAGCMFTGLFYSWKTTWGFTKHRWIVAKWLLLSMYGLFGLFWFLPWLASSISFVSTLPPAQPIGEESASLALVHRTLVAVHASFVLLFMYLSVKKPSLKFGAKK